MAKNHGYDITGQRFGKLIVLSKGISKGPGRTTWNCLCDCGNKKTLRGDALKSGNAKNCGNCLKSERAADDIFATIPIPVHEVCKQADMQGLTFGQYVAKEYAKRL